MNMNIFIRQNFGRGVAFKNVIIGRLTNVFQTTSPNCQILGLKAVKGLTPGH